MGVTTSTPALASGLPLGLNATPGALPWAQA